VHRAPGKVRIFISITPISSPSPMFDHLLESSHRDDSNKWSNIGFGEEDSNKWSNIGFCEEIAILESKKRSLSGALVLSRLNIL